MRVAELSKPTRRAATFVPCLALARIGDDRDVLGLALSLFTGLAELRTWVRLRVLRFLLVIAVM